MTSLSADLLGTARGRRALAGSLLAAMALPVSALITGPIFARTIGASGRGEATAVTAPLILAVGLISGGLYSSSVYYVSKRADHLVGVLRGGLKLSIGGGIVLAISLYGLAPILARQTPDLITPIRWCSLAVPVIVVGRVARGVAMAQRRYRFVYGTTVVSAAVRTTIVVAAALSNSLDVTVAILVLIGYEVLPSIAMIMRQVGPFLTSPDVGAGPSLNRFARYSGAASVGSATSHLTTRLDLVILAPLVAPSVLGAYVFAFGLTSMWSSVVRALAGTALPEVSRTGDHEAAATLCRLLVLASIIAIVTTIAVGPWIVGLVYGDGYDETARLLPLLMVGSSIYALEHIPGVVLLAAGKPRQRSAAQSVGAIVTVIGLAVAVPTWGVWGAAIASTAAYLSTAFITLGMLKRTVGQRWTDFVVIKRTDVELVATAASSIRARIVS